MKIRNKKSLIISTICIFAGAASLAGAIFISQNKFDVVYLNSEDDLLKINDKLDGYYVLKKKIEITKPWVPIGTEEKPFTGHIEGNNRSIILSGGYDTNYINSSTNSSSFNLGFIGVNKGTIIHLNVKDSSIGNFAWSSLENKVNLNYGIVSAVNIGYITGCKTAANPININSNINSANIGGICGINKSQIQGCSAVSTLNITTNCQSNVAAICGLQENSGVIKYCYKSAELQLNLGSNSNSALCVGLCKGGEINNIGLSSNDEKLVELNLTSETYSAGALIGKADLTDNLTISNIVADISLISEKCLNSFGFICGEIVNNGKILNCKNICLSGSVTIQNTDSNTSGLLFGNYLDKNLNKYDNVYYYSVTSNYGKFNYFGLAESNYNDLSLSKLNFDEAAWKKGKHNFYLTYGQK